MRVDMTAEITFLIVLGIILAIGLASGLKKKKSAEDYLLASRHVPAWLAGLSAIATNNSGYMFIGMIGYTYLYGLSSIWLMVGWIAGDLAASLIVHRRLRLHSERFNEQSIGGLLSGWDGQHHNIQRKVIGFFIVLFLSVYAAAQLGASAKVLTSLFSWDKSVGVLIAGGAIFLYSIVGGLRASIWTDAAQSFVMIFSMGLIVYFSLEQVPFGDIVARLEGIDGYLDLFPHYEHHAALFSILFVIGWFFGGVGAIGQPHILIRFMALRDVSKLNRMRVYYYGWFFFFYLFTIIAGLLSRAMLPEGSLGDSETALIILALKTLPEFFIGVFVAGIFSATMSTADSLILSSSASLTRDFTRRPIERYSLIKLGTFSVTATAVLIALQNNKTVFAMVLDAWGVLASALGPLLILYALGYQVPQKKAISLILAGAAGFYLYNAAWGSYIYAIAPAMMTVFLLFAVVWKKDTNKGEKNL